MTVVNRVNTEKFSQSIEAAKKNPKDGEKTISIEGEWRLSDPTGPQFQAAIKLENREVVITSDEPGFLGGGGNAPSPVHYCIYGAVACFAATFAKWAAMEGVVLKGLKVKAVSEMDMTRSYGLTDNPTLKRLSWDLIVESEASDEKLAEIKKLAEERCPAYFCLTQPITPVINVKRK